MEKHRISFGDPQLSSRAKANLQAVIESGHLSEGPMVKKFEEAWGKKFGYPYNIAVSNGTNADIAACLSLYEVGAKRGDEIIAPALAFAAVGNSIIAAGFKPVFVDIKRETLNINPKTIEEKITKNTIAIMAVHTMGKPCDMEKIKEITQKHSLYLIEDSCEAHGAKYKAQVIGSFGDLATFSGYAAHLVWMGGEGGMVSTNIHGLEPILRSIRSHGREPGQKFFNHIRLGLNLRMQDFNAAVGLAELADFDQIFAKRKENFYYLTEKTKDLEEFAHFLKEEPYELIAPHAFSLVIKNPKITGSDITGYLEEKGIEVKRNFGSMPTQHEAFSHLGYRKGIFPEAEYVGDYGIHFGIHQNLNQDDLDYISSALHDFFHRSK